MDNEIKLQLEISEAQANTIQEALNLYMRLGLGQFEEIDMLSYFLTGKINIYDAVKLKEIYNQLKQIYHPALGFYSISSDKTPETCKVAYDLIQVLRYNLSWHKNPSGGMTVNYDKPIQFSKEELCNCNVIKKE